MASFTLTREVTETFDEGWGVEVIPIWVGEDDGPEQVADIDVMTYRITAQDARLIGGAWCVTQEMGGGLWGCPIANFLHAEDLPQDDTHDLRSRWFATEQEAEDHARSTIERWMNPEPWCSFVKL